MCPSSWTFMWTTSPTPALHGLFRVARPAACSRGTDEPDHPVRADRRPDRVRAAADRATAARRRPPPAGAQVPRTGGVVEDARIRLLRPSVAETPRRVAIQAGHWRTDEAPAEFPRLRFSSGGEAAGSRAAGAAR